MPHDHVCDRAGIPTKIIDASEGPVVTCTYPSCSVCGTARVFGPGVGSVADRAAATAR